MCFRSLGISLVFALALSSPAFSESETKAALRLADDARLAAPHAWSLHRRPVDEVLKEISEHVGIPLTPDRAIADDRVTLHTPERPTGETLDRLADALGYFWLRRKGGYELQADLSRRAAEETEERRRATAALAQLPALVSIYEETLDNDTEELERLRNLLDRELATESDPARRLRLRQQRRAAAELMEPGIRMFASAFRDLVPEERQELATGQPITMTIRTQNANGQPTFQEAQVRQRIDGDRAQICFRTLEPVTPSGAKSAPNVLEWRLTTLGTHDPRPTTHDPRQQVPSNDQRLPKIWLAAEEVAAMPADGSAPLAESGAATPVVIQKLDEGRVRVRSNAWVRPMMAEFATAIATATGLPVIADSFTRPVSIRAAQGEALSTLLDQFCERNSARWQLEEGVLVLRSLTPANDRRREVPERHLRQWLGRRTGAALPLLTLAEMATTLTDLQLETLEERWALYTAMPQSFAAVGGGISLTTSRTGLRFLGNLTGGQREMALRLGLPWSSLLPEQRKRFAAVFAEALPDAPAAGAAEIASGSFRIRTGTQLVRLSHQGSRQWEPVSEDVDRENDCLLAHVPITEVGFYVASQEAPRVVFRHQGEPEVITHTEAP